MSIEKSPPSPEKPLALSHAVRVDFLENLSRDLTKFGELLEDGLFILSQKLAPSMDEGLARRDSWLLFRDKKEAWVTTVKQKWHDLILLQNENKEKKLENLLDFVSSDVMLTHTMELENEEVADANVLSQRFAAQVREACRSELEDLFIRIKQIETKELPFPENSLAPEALIPCMINEWRVLLLGTSILSEVSGGMMVEFKNSFKRCCIDANSALIKANILPAINLRDRVQMPIKKAKPAMPIGMGGYDGASEERNIDFSGGVNASGFGDFGVTHGPINSRLEHGEYIDGGHYSSSNVAGNVSRNTDLFASPTNARAAGVVKEMRRLFINRVGADFLAGGIQPPSHGLSTALRGAMARARVEAGLYETGGEETIDFSESEFVKTAVDKSRTEFQALQDSAKTKSEKTVIEIVGIMFSSILSESKIPSSIRIFMAQLQIPVLRVALEDATFLGSPNHPARLLIDRIGACVMGLDAEEISSNALNDEIKRIVQTIEQYPEAGKKVWVIMHKEFLDFLAGYLTQGTSIQKTISIASKIEQKETLTIQYTLELKKILCQVEVNEHLREFFYKIWAEVMARSALKDGIDDINVNIKTDSSANPTPHERIDLASKKYRKTAVDLLAAASGKKNHEERTEILKRLPTIVGELKEGMNLAQISADEQDKYIEVIRAVLSEAFSRDCASNTPSPHQIQTIMEQLASLDDAGEIEGLVEIPLNQAHWEKLAEDRSETLMVVADSPSSGISLTKNALTWSAGLTLGGWFTLLHERHSYVVQLVWRSKRGVLHLFEAKKRSFLFPTRGLAEYFQIGLIVPQEEDTLTIRAGRYVVECMSHTDSNEA